MPGPLDLTNEKISFSFDRLIQTDGAGNFFNGLGDPVSITGAGTSGTSGTSGLTGTSGTSGIGTSGTSGVDGTSGTSGITGTSGSSGTSGASGTSGTSGTIEFYYSQTPPSPDPTNVGARWLDSDNGIEYVWVWDGSDYYWVQPTQLGRVTYKAFYINAATYSPTFAYEYYGVTYTGGICTITLPLGVVPTDEGKFINIADEVGGISYGNRGILVQGQGGQLINGEASVLMKIDRMSLNFLFRNNSWKTI
jgi:hypothetical protein